jgi:hypothetical protein
MAIGCKLIAERVCTFRKTAAIAQFAWTPIGMFSPEGCVDSGEQKLVEEIKQGQRSYVYS